MGNENSKVLLFSTVRDMLESQGWILYRLFNNEYIFKNEAGDILALPQHPKKPRLLYLDDLLTCSQILRQEFIEAARQEWNMARCESIETHIHFDVWLDPGDADISDIQALFSTLSDLNRAAGGYGLAFCESETVRYTGIPAATPLKFEDLQKKAIFRTMGFFLCFCKDHIGPDADILKGREDRAVLYAKKIKIAEAVKKYSRADQKKARNKQQRTEARLSDTEMLKQVGQVVKTFHRAAKTIKKKGGNVSLDKQQLLHNLRRGCKGFPRDTILSSLFRRLSSGPNETSDNRDTNDIFRKIKETGKLPTPATKAFKIFRLANDDETNISDLAAIVGTDPAIAARILKIANSAFYKSLNPITSVQEAIIRLGLKMVKRISLGLSLISAHNNGPCVEFDYDLFWAKSLARAVVARNLTDVKQSVFNAEEAFTVGLLCQIGRLAFATAFAKEYADVLRQTGAHSPVILKENEKRAFGIDHNELAAELMADWRLPDVFCKAVRFQDSFDEKKNLTPGSPEYELTGLLQWPAKMSNLFTQSGAKREFLESVIKEASQMDLGGDKLAQWFDSTANEWEEMGDILEVKTRKVRPWNEIYSQIN